ncbi:MFS transporter [Salinadaptatus halalkaliphilus]|uniref:MFS transporter n=1 Tax=Salinadaptatus halalkaliphilus TaxID=2419781 RepID=A0A4S3TT62_9EURY|nr:MFS transporter [Salinadaptatus halalkaliphilus]THE65788.1 MFS transporter [Salinadaptatus halalkaliphilus]
MAASNHWTERSTVGLVSGGHFLSHFYIIVFPPLFPLLRAEFDVSTAALGLIVSIISLGMLLQIPVGELVDRIGAKWILVAGIATTSIGVMVAGLANTYLVLVAGAAISGIGQASFHPANYPLLEAVSDDDRLGKNFSIHTFGGYVGFAAAPVIVGFLALTAGWRSALLLVGAVGVGYAVLTAVLLEPVYQANLDGTDDEAETASTSSLSALLQPTILIMAVFFIVFTMAEKGIQTFTPLLVIDGFGLSETVGNTTLSVFFAVASVTVLLGGVLADRYDPRAIIAGATTIAAGTMFVAVVDVVPIGALAAIVTFAVAGGAFGLVFASRDRLVSTYAAEGSTGRSFGFVFTASSLGSLSTPLLLGAAIDLSSTILAFALIAGCFLLSGLVVLLIGERSSAFLTGVASRGD